MVQVNAGRPLPRIFASVAGTSRAGQNPGKSLSLAANVDSLWFQLSTNHGNMNTMKFTKMHGAGNDYVYVDCFAEKAPSNLPELARNLSHRHFGVGADGLILIRPSEIADARMQMFNADGSESEMCGNGIRCVAKYVHDHGLAKKTSLKIETGAGVLGIDLHVAPDGKVSQVTVDMGTPELEASKIPTTLRDTGQVIDMDVEFGGQVFKATCVSMGNPHCIVFVQAATDDLVLGLGPVIESDPRFPNRTNIEFVEVISPTEVRQRTWERGSGKPGHVARAHRPFALPVS
jgi:diaminopimelate epimerase